MFDKFGEFDSVEELNRAAAAQKAEGDEEALVELAKENGIDKEDAEDYMDDCIDELATPLSAALGKIKVEAEVYRIQNILIDWVQELETECTDSEELARAVRRKCKGLDGYIAALADAGFRHKAVVSKDIVSKCSKELKKMAGNHEFYIGVPDKATRKRIMKEYYLRKQVIS